MLAAMMLNVVKFFAGSILLIFVFGFFNDSGFGSSSAVTTIDNEIQATTTQRHTDFDNNDDGFVFIHDALYDTTNPKYSAGLHSKWMGYNGTRGLVIHLGGFDHNVVYNMSGGWARDYYQDILSSNGLRRTEVGVSFRYRMEFSESYELDAYSTLLVSFDSNIREVVRLKGGGGGSDDPYDGLDSVESNFGVAWKHVSFFFPNVLPKADDSNSATLVLGCYNSKKTSMRQSTRCFFDDVAVTASALPTSKPSSTSSPHPTSFIQSTVPSFIQTDTPTTVLSDSPTIIPTTVPFNEPTENAGVIPSDEPTEIPSTIPSDEPTIIPTFLPSNRPSGGPTTFSPTAMTYEPGKLNVLLRDDRGRGVRVSNGMMGRAIAYSGQQVAFTDGTGDQSLSIFHSLPDAAGVFPNTDMGGFYYVSNSEDSPGGVGTIEFSADGEVTNYFGILSGTHINCGGGKTPWGTWISCEENGNSGRVWQTDPAGRIYPRRTEVVNRGGNYESFAYDDRYSIPTFYTTEDHENGPLVRFTPDDKAMECYHSAYDADKWCTLESGSYSYLQLNPDGECDTGTFTWEQREHSANPNLYPNVEGIDCKDGKCYFVSKAAKRLFTLDLDNGTYTCRSTISGAFNREPDQIKIILDDPLGIVYFCEDGGHDCGIHGRDMVGQFFSIIDGPGYNTETTGLAFSPDARYMFVSFQDPGLIWQFWREDGLPFTGNVLDIKYHAYVKSPPQY